MNQARDIKSNQIIDAESLKNIYEDGLSEYECIDESCQIKLIPSSYKPTNKNRPYFKSSKGINHKKTCKFSEYLRLLDKGKSRSLTSFELEDMPFPTKFEKPKKNESVSITYKSNDIDKEETVSGGTRRISSGEFIETLNKSNVVASISPIVDFYLKCPFNRDIELEIENVKKMYMFWFKRIGKPISNGKYIGKKIFFGRLHTSRNNIIESKEFLEITLYECENWGKTPLGGKTQINPFTIEIDKSIITTNKLTRIKNELNYAIEDKINAFTSKIDEKKKHAFVFFLGEAPNKTLPYRFKVNDGNLIARYTQIHPTGSKKNHIQ